MDLLGTIERPLAVENFRSHGKSVVDVGIDVLLQETVSDVAPPRASVGGCQPRPCAEDSMFSQYAFFDQFNTLGFVLRILLSTHLSRRVQRFELGRQCIIHIWQGHEDCDVGCTGDN